MIRLAVLGDAQQIAEVHVQSWNETYTGMIKQEIIDRADIEKRVQLWQQIFSHQDHHVLVYEQDGQIVGFLSGYFNTTHNIAEIDAFYLLKKIQKQGVGREIFERFYQYAHAKHYQFIRLGVINKNPSRHFYEKLGGNVLGEEILSDYGDGITEVSYQWDINHRTIK